MKSGLVAILDFGPGESDMVAQSQAPSLSTTMHEETHVSAARSESINARISVLQALHFAKGTNGFHGKPKLPTV